LKISLLGAIVNGVASFMLVSSIGIAGAAIGTLLANIIVAFMFYRLGHDKFPIPYQWTRVALQLILFLIISVIFYAIGYCVHLSILSKSLLFLASAIFLLFSGLISPQEFSSLKVYALKKLSNN